MEGIILIDLNGKVALVTGAGRSVGRGIAEVLASAGAFVYVNDLHVDRSSEVVESIAASGGAGRSLPFDVTDSEAVGHAIEMVTADDRVIEILVNNAGDAEGSSTTLFSQSGPEDWRPTIDLNVFGTMNVVRAIVPFMIERGWGRVIQISSGASSVGLPIGVSAYGAAKAAAESLIRHVAVENGRHGITANVLALGLMANVAASDNEVMKRMLAAVPVGRLGTPEEVGLAAAWLSSEGGGFVTGQVIHLNGGSVFGR
jgi:NAD(P)-dependent dehydrogenase (short-subunit alcohol dehydrogenase family)